ncbi:response regulator [Legionella micdadei]|uniref:response regulator n=1 Tax=Legionella micdadei TaxID=451 RepID=UPI0020C66852|nr:response regulator [Legionella micdadei]
MDNHAPINQSVIKSLDSLFFLSSPKESEKIVFFIDKNHIIQKVILKTNQEALLKLSSYDKKSFTEALEFLHLDTNRVLNLIQRATASFFEHSEFSDKELYREYMLSASYTGTIYVVILTLINRTNEALKTYINTIINTLPGAIYWKDTEGHYMGCNQFVAQMAGFERPEHIIGKTDFDLCWKEFAQEWRDLDLEVMRENKTYKREETAKLANGSIITELTIKSPLYNEKNEIVGIIGTSMDITEQKILEHDLVNAQKKAEAASLAKTEFLENMRHDIRTPLSGIVGFAEILKTESKEPQTQEYADNLIASSHALLDLMDDVLEAIRVSSGEIPMLRQKFDLKALLKNVIDLNLAKSKAKKLQLHFLVDENLPQYVIGDKIRIHRVILELVGNALNFTNAGHVTLTADLAKKQDRQLIIRIKVSDSGVGIPPEKQQDIYLQFKRLTPSYKGIYKGAGLGLYIVRQFIDELEAEISVNSQVGVGTSFTCIIPLQEPLLADATDIDNHFPSYKEHSLPSNSNSTEDNKNKEGTSKKTQVLVVEDNVIAQKVVKTILSSMNCAVDLASNGKEALNKVNLNHYDLIFMDIGLGQGADGYEVTREIRKREKDSDHVPIVALTAHAAEENKQRCVEAGMDAVLSKPITQNHASNILNGFIRKEKAVVEPQNLAKLDLPDTEEELFELEQYPLLEIEQALKNLGSKSILIDLLENLVDKAVPEDFLKMQTAFAAQNYEQVEKLAHKIKGGAVYVGTIRMKYACQYLERYWKSGQRELFEKLYKQAVSVIEETVTYVKNWLKTASK